MANKPLISLTFPDLSDTYTIPTKVSDLDNDSGFTTHGVPSGGSANQVLAKASGTDYDLTWVNQSGGGSSPSPSSSTPQPLGTAAAGSSTDYSRGDHVHAMPSAADVGAIAAPASPSSGQFLVYNGSAWAAQSLSVWQGGSY